MKLDDMRIEGRSGTRVQTVSAFTVQNEDSKQRENSSQNVRGAAFRIGVCFLAVMGAFALRVVNKTGDAVAEVSTTIQSDPQPTDTIGSLRYVSNDAPKWSAPVKTNDIELLRDRQLMRFTATEIDVFSCISGTVSVMGTDDRFGQYLRIQGDDGIEIVLYGFDEISVSQKQKVQEQSVLGTVPVGRSVYLSVERNGAPLDPASYIDMTIAGRHETV